MTSPDKPLKKSNAQVKAESITPLMHACKRGDKAAMLKHLQDGADVNERDFLGKSALYFAAEYKRTKLIKALLDAGANPLRHDFTGITPYQIACASQQEKMIYQMECVLSHRHHKPNYSMLQRKLNQQLLAACANKDYESIDELLKRGANPNARDEEGRTPLMLSCTLGWSHEDWVLAIIDAGADIHAADKQGKTCLMHAASHMLEEVILRLVLLGVDVDVQDEQGMTALMYSFVDNVEIDHCLLIAGNCKNINITDHQGRTALDHAQANGCNEMNFRLPDFGAKYAKDLLSKEL